MSQGGKALVGLDFGGIWPHALGSKNCTIKGNLRLPDLAFFVVEDDTMVLGCCHQVQEVLIMLLRGTAEYTYIIMNGNNAE